MKAVILWELRQRRLTILWWAIGTFALIAMLMLLYPSIHDQAAQLNKVLDQLPDSLKALKTGGTNVDITSPVGYLHSQIFYITLPLLWIIYAVTRGSGLLGKEEESKTIELLLARPISRGRLLAGKAVAGAIELALLGVAALLSVIGFAMIVGLDVSYKHLAITTIITLLFCLSFGAISFTLTAMGRFTKKASTTIAVALAFGGYIIASLSSFSSALDIPAKVMPYTYFAPDALLRGDYNSGLFVYLFGVLLFAFIGSFLGFRRRDLS